MSRILCEWNRYIGSSSTIALCFRFRTPARGHFPASPSPSCYLIRRLGWMTLRRLTSGHALLSHWNTCLFVSLPGDSAPRFVYLFPTLLCALWLFVSVAPSQSAPWSCHSKNVWWLHNSTIPFLLQNLRTLPWEPSSYSLFLPIFKMLRLRILIGSSNDTQPGRGSGRTQIARSQLRKFAGRGWRGREGFEGHLKHRYSNLFVAKESLFLSFLRIIIWKAWRRTCS